MGLYHNINEHLKNAHERLDERIGKDNVRRLTTVGLAAVFYFMMSTGVGCFTPRESDCSQGIAVKVPNGDGIIYLSKEQYDLIPENQREKVTR
jgi:hypothetical protein